MRIIKALENVTIYKHEDEYIVHVPENPDADYFTGDWEDANNTASVMDKQLAEA